MSHQRHLDDLLLENDGLLSFERFMREALYHVRYGYYSNVSSIGRRGDFSTTPTLHAVLGEAMARWAVREKKETLGLGVGKTWHVIEVGAGDGSLARSFLDSVGLMHRLTLTYHIVEISESLQRKQKEKVPQRNIKWHRTMKEALDAAGGKALIFSNELVDAFPFCLVEWNAASNSWREVYVRDLGHDGLGEALFPLSQDRQGATSTVFGDWNEDVPLKDGQRCEIHWSYQAWLKEWVPSLVQGTVLTIDYGNRFPTLYHRKPNGTARGYFQGVRLERTEIYDRFGRQDLTADVNFSDLINWGKQCQLETVDLKTQREFLIALLPGIENPGRQQQDPALEFLMSPYGAGDSFKVLCQRRV